MRSGISAASASDHSHLIPAVTAIVVVADVRLYREGLRNALSRRENFVIEGEATSLESALRIVTSTHPDVVVLDMATQGSLEIARAINRSAPAVKVVAFAVEEVDRNIFACAEAGIAAWVAREGTVDDLATTIESITREELVCSARMAAAMFRRLGTLAKSAQKPAEDSPLTAREREIVVLIERGLSNKAIAHRLTIEVATVKNHVHSILGKLNVATRAEAAACRRTAGTTGGLS